MRGERFELTFSPDTPRCRWRRVCCAYTLQNARAGGNHLTRLLARHTRYLLDFPVGVTDEVARAVFVVVDQYGELTAEKQHVDEHGVAAPATRKAAALPVVEAVGVLAAMVLNFWSQLDELIAKSSGMYDFHKKEQFSPVQDGFKSRLAQLRTVVGIVCAEWRLDIPSVGHITEAGMNELPIAAAPPGPLSTLGNASLYANYGVFTTFA